MKIRMIRTVDMPTRIWRDGQEIELDQHTAEHLIQVGDAVAVEQKAKAKPKRAGQKKKVEDMRSKPETENAIETVVSQPRDSFFRPAIKDEIAND